MKAVLLNGSAQGDRIGEQVTITLTEQLQAAGWNVESVLVREKKIGNCAGNFLCWVRTPGICMTNDDNHTIAAAIAHCDLLVYLTPVTFGGYSSTLKRMVDHQIQNFSPFFTQINGETHHQKRYERYPDFLAVGWMDAPNPRAEAIFRHLVYRNRINFYSKKSYCGLTYADQSEAERQAQVGAWLQALSDGSTAPMSSLPDAGTSGEGTTYPPHSAVLLVGSPRTHKSTSYMLGSYLMNRLAAHDVRTETIQVYPSLNSPEKTQLLLEKLDAADLAVLAFPLYVDSLPAPVIELLEYIAAHSTGHPRKTRLAALANCGFPEAGQNTTALAICEEFAHQSGITWSGGLSLGAGQGLVHGMPIDELDGRANALKKALDLSAEALAKGEAIPQDAQDLLSKPFIPAWLYRLFGDLGWKVQAKEHGAEKHLRRQSY